MNSFLTKSTGFIYLLLYVVCASTIPIAIKIGLRQEASALELLVFRMLLAAVLLWAYFLWFRRDALRIDRAGLIGCMQVAIANCASTSTYFFALAYLDASLMLLVNLTAFIPGVMLLLMIRGEYPNRLDLFRAAVALIGIYLFIGLVGSINPTGIALAIATGFFYALYMALIQLRLGGYDSQTVLLYVITFMAILLSVIYLALGYRGPQFDAVAWAAVLWIAIVATVIARLLLFAGIKIAGSRQAALLSPLEALLTVLFAVSILGESLTLQQWVGSFLVIGSVALGAKVKSDRARPDATKATEVPSKKEKINE